MKTIKETKRTIAIFLTYVFFIPTIVSCSSDKPSNDEVNSSYNEIAKKYEGIAMKMANIQDNLNNYSLNSFQNRSINGVELTQESIDEYAVLAGYEEGFVTLSLVEEIIDKNEDLIEFGYMQVLEDLNLGNFTKLKISEIIEGGWIEDLQESPEYENLNGGEKEVLALANTYAKEISMMPTSEQARFWDGFTSGVVGAVVGLAVFSSGIGVVAGFFIGIYIHSLAK
ncbi:MAG: hypothetical protein R2783_10160 [Gelidibacter sp.]